MCIRDRLDGLPVPIVTSAAPIFVHSLKRTLTNINIGGTWLSIALAAVIKVTLAPHAAEVTASMLHPSVLQFV